MILESALIEPVVAALARLAAIGEGVEDEWTYVRDLETVWTARLRAVAAGRSGRSAAPEIAAAIERLCDEAARVSDPHRAIDWLSTLPQAALVAVGEAAW